MLQAPVSTHDLAAWQPPACAVVIPTFRERDNVAPLFARLSAVLAGTSWEAIYVDDDSGDGTAEAVLDLMKLHPNVRLIRRIGRRGLSSAVVEGMLATGAPVVAVIDGDMQHDEAALPKLFAAIRDDGADVAIGTRYSGEGSIGDWSGGRARISRAATALANRLQRNPVSDPMSGFFAIRQDLLIKLAPRLSLIGFKLLLDILMTSRERLKVREIPYTFRSRVAGESKLDASNSLDFLLLLIEKKLGGWFPARFVMFVAVGGVGLFVHLLLLRLFLWTDIAFGWAQGLAVAITIAFNFSLNNVLTYRDQQLRGWQWLRGLISFYAVCGLGAVANVGVATFIYTQSSNDQRWWLAGVAGAAIGAVWNYSASRFLTWRRR
jgi:dolichol-phosphate mannosyltransferase